MMLSVCCKRAVIVAGLTVSCGVFGMDGGGAAQDNLSRALHHSVQVTENLKRINATGLKSGWTNFGMSVVALMAAGVGAFVVDSCQRQYCLEWIYKKSCEIKAKYFAAVSPQSKHVDVIAKEGAPGQTCLKQECGGTESR